MYLMSIQEVHWMGCCLPLHSDGIQSTWAEALLFFMLETQYSCEELSTKTLWFVKVDVPEISKLILFITEKQPEDDSSQAFLSAQNGSPRQTSRVWPGLLPRSPTMLSLKRKWRIWICLFSLQSKPPPGGKGSCV